MKTMVGYIIGAAIAWLLAGSLVQADIYFDADFVQILIILSIGPVLAVIAGIKKHLKTAHRFLTG